MSIDKALQDLRQDEECEKCSYCPLEPLIRLNHRVLEQHKIAEFFKWKLGQEGKPNLSWDEVYMIYEQRGLARKFAEVYSENKSYKQIRREMFGE